MTTIDLENLVSEVKASQSERVIEKIEAHREQVERWCKDKGVSVVERLAVPRSERDIVDDKGKIIAKEYYADDKDIIEVIKAAYPDTIDNTIYFFPQGSYLFITDKGVTYNLHSKPRELSKDEQARIDNLRSDMVDRRAALEDLVNTAKVLQAAYLIPAE